MMDNLDRFQKFILTVQEILISISLDCRAQAGLHPNINQLKNTFYKYQFPC